MTKRLFFSCLVLLLMTACKEELPEELGVVPTTDKVLKIKFHFDPAQERLNNIGLPADLPAGHAVQTPDFQALGAHFLELVPQKWTPYQSGAFVYKGEEVTDNTPNSFGFNTAIDFSKAIRAGENEFFLEIPIAELDTGTYRHVRVSVAYQNYQVAYNLKNIPTVGDLNNQTGTVASFVGYNTYIEKLLVNEMETAVNQSKLQGFWAFETAFEAPYSSYNQVFSGQAPANATTVVNPFPEAPIPQGSCVVSGSLDQPLTITGQETADIELTLSFSINGSFEWEDNNANGEWDIDAQNPGNSEAVVDMGLRGLKASHDK